ncbi:MAG: HAMP domain-containing histidine kinase [Oscillospiraceae bacterium]|nr:HAMP domain-containing histidine kinase [Oscillospiraceae bacterium]
MKIPSVRKLRFFSSIRTKFALTYFAVVAIVLVLINTYFLTESRNIIFSLKQQLVQSQAALIASRLEETFETLVAEDDELIATVVSQLEVAGSMQIVITDTEGEPLYDPSGRAEHEDFPEHFIITALSGTTGHDIFFTRFRDGAFSSEALAPITGQGNIIGVVYVYEHDTDQGSMLLVMQDTIRNISVIVIIFSVAAITLILWSVMGRVNSIISAIESVREGEYSYLINMRGNDELAMLGDEFDSLTGRLRETDEVRRRFVSDASHELKTPLASIRLLADSILQNKDIERETIYEFISDISLEADRLERTTGKLMTLTRLDSHLDDEKTSVDMKAAVDSTLRMLRPLASTKGLILRSALSEGCYIYATEDSVHHIIFNLIENAIKYNQPDGSVYVRLETIDKTVVLTIKDRGVGVPEEDVPYIFDRFYRVDKARSREAGGSGLGLAIVKDTVLELGGNVKAESRKGGGMSFYVIFDLYDKDININN